jgi:hypothetical protein
MSWLGRGIGDFGSQVGQGFDINLGWKERLQNMAMQNARQKLADLKGPLELQELQQRVKQMGQPQPAGVVKGPGGETSGVTFDPATSTYSVKTLIPGAVPEPKFPTLQAAAAYYLQKGDFDKLKLVNDEIDRNKTQKTPEGYTDVRPDTQGRLWGFNKANNKFEQIQTTAKFRGENEKTPSEYDQRIANYLAANGMKDTPSNRDTADQALGVRNKQNDRVDATKAVTTALNAQKGLQSLEVGIQKTNKVFSIWNPKTWGADPALTAVAQRAVDDYNQKRQDAVEKLTDAGMPIPEWLSGSTGAGSAPPPPPGFHK